MKLVCSDCGSLNFCRHAAELFLLSITDQRMVQSLAPGVDEQAQLLRFALLAHKDWLTFASAAR